MHYFLIFSRKLIPRPSHCSFYTCYRKEVPIDNTTTTTTTTTTAAPPTPPPTPAPLSPGLYFFVAMAFVALFALVTIGFALYCVIKQYFWQRRNRQMGSPNEHTPIIRPGSRNSNSERSNRNSRNLDLNNSNVEVEVAATEGQPMVTFRPPRTSNAQLAAELLGKSLAEINYGPICLIHSLEPYLSSFKPKNLSQLECGRFLQRLQIMVICHELRCDSATADLNELGTVFSLTSADPNSESCK